MMVIEQERVSATVETASASLRLPIDMCNPQKLQQKQMVLGYAEIYHPR